MSNVACELSLTMGKTEFSSTAKIKQTLIIGKKIVFRKSLGPLMKYGHD